MLGLWAQQLRALVAERVCARSESASASLLRITPLDKQTPGRSRRGDFAAVFVLLATALVIAEPIWTGGYETYIDNPVHLAEIADLSRYGADTWSEIAFAGFPIGTVHSPLWYTIIAAATRAGLPVGPLYAGFVILGFAAPALGIYAVTRRRAPAFQSAALAFLVLIQPTMIAGIGSPLGGMWTHGLAAAGVVLLADLWSRPRLTPAAHWLASSLLALIALTHLFALTVSIALFAVSTALNLRRDPDFAPELYRRLAGCAVAAIASATYWLTFWLTVEPTNAPWDALGPLELLARLFLPTNVLYLLESQIGPAIRWDLYLTDALPLVGLIALGAIGFFRERQSNDLLGRIGVTLAAVLLVAIAVTPLYPLRVLGPVSWRLLLWVRLGGALSAACWVRALPGPRSTHTSVALATCAVASGLWWGLPLARAEGERLARDLTDTRALWRWLSRNASSTWGRLYLQDTFGQKWARGGLDRSHILALTANYTDLPQLGVYYGVVPFKLRWTLSEFGALFGSRHLTSQGLLASMRKTNALAIVSSSRVSHEHFAAMDELEEVYSQGRYRVFLLRGEKSAWIAPLRPTNRVEHVEYSRGHVEFDLTTEYPRARVLIKTSWHPWWHLSGPPGTYLRESPEGFLVVDNIGVGKYHLAVSYRPSRLPLAVTIAGASIWLIWGAWLLVRRRRHGA